MLHPLVTVPAVVGTILSVLLLVAAALQQSTVPAIAGIATGVTTVLTVLSQYITVKVKTAQVVRAARAAAAQKS